MYRTGRQPNPNMDGNDKQVMVRLFLMVALPILWVVGIACKPEQEPKFGLEFNATRKQVGLPLINEKWEHTVIAGYASHPTLCKWGDDKLSKDQKNGYVKNVYYFTEPTKILYELDVYLRLDDKWVTPGDIDHTEDMTALYIRYYFRHYTPPDGGKPHAKGWECELKEKKHNFMNGYKSLTLAQADSVLRVWGVNRLDP